MTKKRLKMSVELERIYLWSFLSKNKCNGVEVSRVSRCFEGGCNVKSEDYNRTIWPGSKNNFVVSTRPALLNKEVYWGRLGEH